MRSKFTIAPRLQRKPAVCKKKPKALPIPIPINLPPTLVFQPAWFIEHGPLGSYTHFGTFTATEDLPNIWRCRTPFPSSGPAAGPSGTGSIWFQHFPDLGIYTFSTWQSSPGIPSDDREFYIQASYTFGPLFNFLIPVQPNPTLAWGTYGCIGHL